MKRLLIVLFILLMCLSLGACSKKEEPADIPNPMVEYESLKEINEKIGVNLIRPGVMGIDNEKFYIINGEIAQYDFELNGKKWTFRGANIFDEDISGVYDIDNVFVAGQGATLYTNSYYLERFFDGDKQYTILASDAGDMLQETFMDCCMEIESIIKYHADDELVGDYADLVSQRASLIVERTGDTYYLQVEWSSSADETTIWKMQATLQDNKLSYAGENITNIIYDASGNATVNETKSNNLGYFEIVAGQLQWTGAADENCRNCIFDKIVY